MKPFAAVLGTFSAMMFGGILSLAAVVYDQQRAIEALIADANESLAIQSNGVQYTVMLHRELNEHIESGCIPPATEKQLLKQMDLLVATSRRGWWDAEGKAIRTSHLFEEYHDGER